MTEGSFIGSHEHLYSASSTSNTISIKWNPVEPITGFVPTYEIKYKEANVEGRYTRDESVAAEVFLFNLRSNTKYEVIIYYANEQGENVRMFPPFNVETKQSAHQSILQKHAVCDDTKPLNICVLKVENTSTFNVEVKIKDQTGKIPVKACEMIKRFDPSVNNGKREKSILLLGETGAGKSTLLDAMINYICEVSFDDNYRYSLMQTRVQEREKNEDIFQTLGMTCYRIPYLEGLAIDFPVNLIDTPGFSDTHSQQFDDVLIDQMDILFGDIIHHLDAICIVVPLACIRLNKSTKDAYDKILKLFGNDIRNNIFVLITKDDGGSATCLDAVKHAGVPFKQSFRFSNADHFLKGTLTEAARNKEFWINRSKVWREFFLAINHVEPMSVERSEKCVKTRRLLKEQLQNMMVNVNNQVKIISEIKRNKNNIANNKEEMLLNGNFICKESVVQKVLKDNNSYALVCHRCRVTCHDNFVWYLLRYLCDLLKSADCTKCNCKISNHNIMKNKYIDEKTEVEITLDKMKAMHEQLQGLEKEYEDELDKNQKHLEDAFSVLETIISRVSYLIDELNKDALKVEFDSIVDCIDHLTEKIKTDLSTSDSEEGINILQKIKTKIIQNQTKRDIDN